MIALVAVLAFAIAALPVLRDGDVAADHASGSAQSELTAWRSPTSSESGTEAGVVDLATGETLPATGRDPSLGTASPSRAASIGRQDEPFGAGGGSARTPWPQPVSDEGTVRSSPSGAPSSDPSGGMSGAPIEWPSETPPAPTEGPVPEPSPTGVPAFADTSVPTRLAWFYKPPAPTEQPAVLDEFDTFVLTKGDEAFRAEVRAARPEARILQYVLLDQIVKPQAGGVELRNNAAYNPGDFDNLWTNHNDWFLKDANGSAVVEGGKFYRMDPGNTEWRAFWVKRVLAANSGWDGVFTDNLDLSLCPYDKAGLTFPQYPTDAAYTDALLGFVKLAYENLTVANGKPISSNLVNGCTDRDHREKYYPYLAGGMDEGWAVDWSTGYVTVARWQADLASVDRFAGQLGREMILVSQGSATDTVRQQFSFASYLLVSGPNVSWRYADYSSYRVPFLFDNYTSALGRPVGGRFTESDGSVRRNFTNGHVVVNPSTHDSAIVVG